VKKIAVEFAVACARRCLENYEKSYPNDKRPSEAIQAAEDYMDGKITLTELNKKLSAAWSADSAARSADSAVRSAAWSADSAARSAAWSADSAAGSAAWSAEKKWQSQKIWEIVRRVLRGGTK
jgi:hypothetical protein